MSLVDFLNSMEEQEEEMTKAAAEEDAAGRIMARGFMDELMKIARTVNVVEVHPKTGLKTVKPVKMPSPSPPAGTGAYEVGKKTLKKTHGYKGMGYQTRQRGALGREGVYGM